MSEDIYKSLEEENDYFQRHEEEPNTIDSYEDTGEDPVNILDNEALINLLELESMEPVKTEVFGVSSIVMSLACWSIYEEAIARFIKAAK